MLISGRISGQREHQPRTRPETKRKVVGEIVGQAEWPGIISPEETTGLRAILVDPARGVTQVVPRRCLLTGILTCSHCNAPLVARSGDDGQMRYVCSKVPGNGRCGKTYVLAAPADELVTSMVRIALDSPALQAAARGRAGICISGGRRSPLSLIV